MILAQKRNSDNVSLVTLVSLKQLPTVVLDSGTGSRCYGRKPNGEEIKVGAWGHILCDKGSAYEIGLRALKASVYYYDRNGRWPKLGRRVLGSLQLNEPKDLIPWSQAASRTEIAGLALEVFSAWAEGDKIATDILAGAAASLASDAAACARRIARPGSSVQFVLTGSNLTEQLRFAAAVRRELRKLWPNSKTQILPADSGINTARTSRIQNPKAKSSLGFSAVVRSTRLSPTEQRNPKSMRLDRMPLRKAVRLMFDEEGSIRKQLLAEEGKIERAIQAIIHAFRNGGRLFYVGSGTSGRLGILDASECSPTFCTPPDLVQGIIAGGQPAIWKSVEGAEDDMQGGRRAIEFRGVSKVDVVVGIAASGRTPFVWGALKEAKKRRATTVLVCFNPFLQIARALRPSIIIAPNVGPELLTGSTRLKAGTATKLILNAFSTLAMVRIGKAMSNLMVDMQSANAKLRDRAARMVQELTGADYERAPVHSRKKRLEDQSGSRPAASEIAASSRGNAPCK